jgi:LCP family protein required for cell wall assembly
MEENRHDRLKQRPNYGAVDGFTAPRPRRRPTSVDQSSPLRQIPASPGSMPGMPKKGHSSPSQQSESLLNATIPGAHPASLEFNRSLQNKKKTQKKLTKKKVALRSMLAVLVLLIGVGGFLGIKGLNTLDKVFHGNVLSDVTAAFNSTPLKGESSGRVNILLAGDSADQIGHGGADLTDSILVLSIDTKNHTAFLLSIPRDLWVDIPGYGWQKINAVNNGLGTNFPGYPKGGMGQLEHFVTTNLGIPIDYYGLMDYGAFKDSVDAVGGVTINVQSPDPRGLYDPNTDLRLPNGPATLDGQEALNLARARGDGYGSYGFPDSDFDRTDHQRQLFVAVAAKAKSLGVLANPVKISDLINTLGNNFQTDLTLQNVLRLIQITKGISPSTVQSYAYCATLNSSCKNPILTDYTDPNSGETALIPTAGIGNYGQLEQYYQKLSSDNPVVKEGASVVVLNGSDVVGLAKQQESILQSKGFDVATIADANNEHPSTMIVDNSNGKAPNSLKLLQKLYPGSTVTSDSGSTEAQEAQGYTADFVVVLGQNWDGTNANTP